jgi:hypothetical protein
MGRERWTSRLTVEGCPIYLSTAILSSAGAFRLPAGTSFTVSWPLSNGSILGSLRVEMRVDWRGPHLFVGADWRGPNLLMGDGQMIRLTTTRPHLGGQRFWFRCECGRRSGRLYLPTGETVFRCRLCYDLTYQSTQEHNARAAKNRELIEYCWQLRASAEARARARKPCSPS